MAQTKLGMLLRCLRTAVVIIGVVTDVVAVAVVTVDVVRSDVERPLSLERINPGMFGELRKYVYRQEYEWI
jgi:hypothetical protein